MSGEGGCTFLTRCVCVVPKSLARDNNFGRERDVHNERNAQDPGDHRTGQGQTAYKRQLAYRCLGINPADVERIAFLQADMRRVARLLSRGHADGQRMRPLDLLEWSDDPETHKVLQKYHSVPATYRRLLPLEAYCLAANVSPWKVLEVIVAVAVRNGAQASVVLAAVWGPNVVMANIRRALTDKGDRARELFFKSTGLLPIRTFRDAMESQPAAATLQPE